MSVHGFIKDKEIKNVSYTTFGREYLGPFLYAYISWLYDEIAAAGIRKVFFFARDGYLMEKAFRLFMEQKNDDMDAQYVYFSRKSIRQTMLWRCNSFKESIKYMTNSRFISLGGILEYWGFSWEERQEIAQQHSLNLSKDYLMTDLTNIEELNELYLELEEQINQKSQEQDKLLGQYIEQIGMKDYCAIVDIGWHGRMQQYLESYFEHSGISIKCIGYYLGIQTIAQVKGETKGFLYDNEHLRLRKSVLAFLGVYEKLFQSHEGSTYGYQKKNGLIEPVLGRYEYENEPENQHRIFAWQDAALDYVREALKNNMIADIAMAMPLVHMGKYPKLRDVRLFSFLCNDDGKKNYFVSKKSLSQYCFEELLHELSNSPWKTGFLKSVFKLPFPYYFIYWIFRK